MGYYTERLSKLNFFELSVLRLFWYHTRILNGDSGSVSESSYRTSFKIEFLCLNIENCKKIPMQWIKKDIGVYTI